MIFYINKKDVYGSRRKFGFYGGNGGGFYCEILVGLYGFLVGVVGVYINY